MTPIDQLGTVRYLAEHARRRAERRATSHTERTPARQSEFSVRSAAGRLLVRVGTWLEPALASEAQR